MEMTGKFWGKLISLGKRSHSIKFRMAVLVMFTVSVLVIFLIVNNVDVYKRQVLYLALEDDYRRLQERLSRMFGVEGTDTLDRKSVV